MRFMTPVYYSNRLLTSLKTKKAPVVHNDWGFPGWSEDYFFSAFFVDVESSRDFSVAFSRCFFR